MLTFTLTLLGLLIGGFGAYFAYRALFPAARALVITALPPRPLLSAPSEHFELKVAGHALEQEPHIVSVVVTAKGRHDVSSSNFEGGSALHLDVGAQVMRILSVTASPERGTTPPCAVTDGGVDLGPGLISTGQTIHLQLLTGPADEKHQLGSRHDLIDVQVETSRGESTKLSAPRGLRSLVIGVASGAAMGGLLVAAAFYDFADRLPGLSFEPSVAIDHELVPTGGDMKVIGANYDAGSLISVDITSEVTGETFDDVCSTQVAEEGAFILDCQLPSGVPRGPAQMTIWAVHTSGTTVEYADFAVVGD